MSANNQVLRSISWRDLCPWLLLLKSFSLAVTPSMLLLGAVAVAVTPVGWSVADQVFLTETDRSDLFRSRQVEFLGPQVPATSRAIRQARVRLANTAAKILTPFGNLEVRKMAYWTFGGLWSLLVAALLGGAISRKSVVAMGREESVGLGDALRFSWRHLASYLLAPIYPIVMLLLIWLACAAVGLTMRLGIFTLLAGAFWFLLLIGGAAAAVLLTGLIVGWPLMWGAVSAEQDGEAFEALSRSYSYVYGRPLPLVFYVGVASLLGAAGQAVVRWFCGLTVAIATAGAQWGAARELTVAAKDDPWLFGAGRNLIQMQNHAVLSWVEQGFMFAFFWAAAAGIYLLLRANVDHTELDEVYVPDDSDALSLPSLKVDASGMVVVRETEAESPAPSEPDSSEQSPADES